MKPALLDVNLLIALTWPTHVHYEISQAWFARRRKAGFRTCPLTQAGFVRISSNPHFSTFAASPREAVRLLERITAMPDHSFWPDDLPLAKAIPSEVLLVGHQQVTDFYLLGLAEHHGGVVATLDRGMFLAAGDSQNLVELVQ